MRKPIVPPPYEIQRRAWECAYVLRQEFDDRLSLEQKVRAEVVRHTDPDGLGWAECAGMFVLHREVVVVRV